MSNELHCSLSVMNQTKDNPAYKPIFSSRMFIGSFIVFGKRVVRRLLKWYMNPVTDQQTSFNNACVAAVNVLAEKIIGLEGLTTQIQLLSDKTDKLDELTAQMQLLSDKTDKLGELTAQIHSLSDKTFKLEEHHHMLKEITFSSSSEIEIIKHDLQIEPFAKSFEKRNYAQSGEDSILVYIFTMLSIPLDTITYLDLGANHAKIDSNTYYLYKCGAKGVLVEANPALIKELSFYRHKDVTLNNVVDISDEKELDFYVLSADGLSTPSKQETEEVIRKNPNVTLVNVEKIKAVTVNTIIEKYFAGQTPTLVSIDIEGTCLMVLKSIDLDKYRPLCIIMETIPYRPYLDINIKENDAISYLNTKDYVEYAFTGINSIFIDKRFIKSKNEGR